MLKNSTGWLAIYLHCSYKSSKPFLKASAFVIECSLANSMSFSCSSSDSLTEILLTFGFSIFGLPTFAIPLPPIGYIIIYDRHIFKAFFNYQLSLFCALQYNNYISYFNTTLCIYLSILTFYHAYFLTVVLMHHNIICTSNLIQRL